MRGSELVDLLRAGSPEAFEVAASLTTEERVALVADVERWLGGVKQASRLPLLAWIDESAWPRLVAAAKAASADELEIVQDRAEAILREAALQAPALVGDESPRVPARHLAFEPGYVQSRWPHPTFVDPPAGAHRYAFGGATTQACGYCHQPLDRLFELGGLELATCLSCLGWEQPLGDYALSYRHDDAGIAHPLDRLDVPLVPQFPNRPFAPTSIALVDLGPRFWRQEWGSARGANLHRAGGVPSWVQDEEIRDCRLCSKPMEVVLQLDSELPQEDKRTFAFGSGGLLYVEVCAPCRTSTLLWQCT